MTPARYILLSCILLFTSVANSADIVNVIVENKTSNALSNVPVTFGQVFKAGDVSSSEQVIGYVDGKQIPMQIDVKAKHEDTSVRHAIITARLPQLQQHSSKTITLASRPGKGSSTPITLQSLLSSNFNAVLTLKVDGESYMISARELLQSGNYEAWLSGTEVAEWITGGPVKSAGTEHPHLAAYFHVRAYAGLDSVRVDVVVENGWTFEPNPKDISYSASLKIGDDNVTLPFDGTLDHYHHTRWHKQYWWGKDLSLYVKHDSNYLQESQAVPKYDNVKITNKYLNSLGAMKFMPMTRGILTKNFGQTGAQDQIGPLPRWTATYVLTTDSRALNALLVTDDHAGTYASHYRDRNTGKPTSVKNHPTLYATNRPGNAVSTPKASGNNPNKLDQAHQPSLAYVAYMVTGDYYYLEELHFWVSWNHLSTNPNTRRQKGKGILLGQVRGQAWVLRNLGQAAFITPDDNSYKGYLIESLNNNFAYNENLYAKNPNSNALGMIDFQNRKNPGKPWMDDFYTWAMGYLVELGFDRARSMRDFKVNNIIQRIGENRDYCWQFASTYQVTLGPGNKGWYKSFDEYWEANWGSKVANGKVLRDVPCGTSEMANWLSMYTNKTHHVNQVISKIRPHSPDSYFARMQPAVAITVDSGLKGSKLAGSRFYKITPVRPNYTDMPHWAIVPRKTGWQNN